MFYFGLGDATNGHAVILVAFSTDLVHWEKDPAPLYNAGGHPLGIDAQHAHKVRCNRCPKLVTACMQHTTPNSTQQYSVQHPHPTDYPQHTTPSVQHPAAMQHPVGTSLASMLR